MNMDKLKEMLRPWMQVETWHTNHPLDDKRFHNALQNVFNELGISIDGGNFEEAMYELADEYHPDMKQDYKEQLVNKFATRAEHIACYLYDTK